MIFFNSIKEQNCSKMNTKTKIKKTVYEKLNFEFCFIKNLILFFNFEEFFVFFFFNFL